MGQYDQGRGECGQTSCPTDIRHDILKSLVFPGPPKNHIFHLDNYHTEPQTHVSRPRRTSVYTLMPGEVTKERKGHRHRHARTTKNRSRRSGGR